MSKIVGIDLCGNLSQSYHTQITLCYSPPHRWVRFALTPARQASNRFTKHGRKEGRVDFGVGYTHRWYFSVHQHTHLLNATLQGVILMISWFCAGLPTVTLSCLALHHHPHLLSSYSFFNVNILQIIKILNLYTPANEFEERVPVSFIRKVQERLSSRHDATQTLLMDTKFLFAVSLPFSPSAMALETVTLPADWSLSCLRRL